MKLGINLRNWGSQATRERMRECARIADASGLDSIWINDHVGLPPKLESNEAGLPDDVGRILDPLGALTFLAGCTDRVALGSAVLLLPYRPKLLNAKWIATIQELSGDRLLLGVGTGWMEEEFRALGVDRGRRGALTDENLDFLHECFANDVIASEGQALRFEPRPPRPPFLIGGAPKVAIPRAIARGDGWIPAGVLPADLKPHVETLQRGASEAGRGPLEVVAMKTLPLEHPNEAVDLARAYREAGATHLVHTQGVESPDQYREVVALLDEQIRPAVA